MSRLKKTLGEQFADQLDDRRGLRRVRVPGRDEEAFTGPVADRALEVLGARAMTLDESIILSEDFDASQSEDAALYAHEAFHARQGAGMEASHPVHDAEETAARAAEQMVFHEMSAGQSDAGLAIQRAVEHGGGAAPAAPAGAGEGPDTPAGIYAKLHAQGQTHDDIVQLLAEQVLQSMDTQRDEGSQRNPLSDPGSFNF